MGNSKAREPQPFLWPFLTIKQKEAWLHSWFHPMDRGYACPAERCTTQLNGLDNRWCWSLLVTWILLQILGFESRSLGRLGLGGLINLEISHGRSLKLRDSRTLRAVQSWHRKTYGDLGAGTTREGTPVTC